jgi:TRAP-type mannitol/chloroaromatic compound transport system permease large subunit
MPQSALPDIQFHFATLSACFLTGVVPQCKLTDIYKGILQFMGLQLLGPVPIIVFPEIALWLPECIYGK